MRQPLSRATVIISRTAGIRRVFSERMIRFDCDYLEGAHPLILQRLLETNLEQTPGYGDDHYSAEAREKIKAACGRPDADVHLLVGGTQTNMLFGPPPLFIIRLMRNWPPTISSTVGRIQ